MSLLGTGGTSYVFKVRHKILGDIRAMKMIAKTSVGNRCFLAEIDILSMMNIKGIPVIYDVEEDAQNWYIIEEYIEGSSLDKYLDRAETDVFEILGFISDICMILESLHTNMPYGIVYGDIKPENIIISNKGVYLIDYGSCALINNVENSELYKVNDNNERIVIRGSRDALTGNMMATKEYVTPEQCINGKIGIWTDVYGIGVLIQKIYQKYQSDLYEWKEEILRIISVCMEKNIQDRYTSTKIIGEAITSIMKDMGTDNKLLNESHKIVNKNYGKEVDVSDRCINIYVFGCRKYAGVTHFSLGFTKFLTGEMSDVLYIENDSSKNIINMLNYEGKAEYSNGIYVYEKCKILPDYGEFCAGADEGLKFDGNDRIVKIYDCGNCMKEKFITDINTSDMVIVVITDIKEYRKFKFEDYILDNNDNFKVLYVANFSDEKGIRKFLRQKNVRIIKMPYIENPFKLSKEARNFYGNIKKLAFVREKYK